jgi:hypothetical protein
MHRCREYGEGSFRRMPTKVDEAALKGMLRCTFDV